MDYQDVLAELGVGSAHPGGFASTMAWLPLIPWVSTMSVLDVGCGTGRTLLEIKGSFGCDIYGIDIRPKMIKKAQIRAKMRGQSGQFVSATAESIPYRDGQFDVVMTESVNVFVDAKQALSEYYRVLKPGGWYVDVEMMILGPVNDEWKTSATEVYGAKYVPDSRGWKTMYANAGFVDIQNVMTKPVNPSDMADIDSRFPDAVSLESKGAYGNPGVASRLHANQEWMETHYRSLGYGVYICKKPQEANDEADAAISSTRDISDSLRAIEK
jgi:SAM-dependent methyltransferase